MEGKQAKKIEGVKVELGPSSMRALLLTVKDFEGGLPEDQWDWGVILRTSGLDRTGLTKCQIQMKYNELKSNESGGLVLKKTILGATEAGTENWSAKERYLDAQKIESCSQSSNRVVDANFNPNLNVTPRIRGKRLVPKKINKDIEPCQKSVQLAMVSKNGDEEVSEMAGKSPKIQDTRNPPEATFDGVINLKENSKTLVTPYVRQRRQPGPATDLAEDLARIMSGNNYGLMFKCRIFSITEWQEVLDFAYNWRHKCLADLTAAEWKELFERLDIPTSKSGEEIMADFYTYAVPNIRSIESHGKKTKLELCKMDQFTHMAIYHRMESCSLTCLNTIIEEMLNEGILAISASLHEWKISFVTKLLTCDEKYFNTYESDLDSMKRVILDELLNKC